MIGDTMREMKFVSNRLNVDHRKACDHLLERQKPRGSGTGRLIRLVLIVLALVLLLNTLVTSEAPSETVLFYASVALLGLAFVFVIRYFFNTQIQRRIQSVGPEVGMVSISFDKEGLRAEQSDEIYTANWNELHGVLATPNALLVLRNPFKYLPIEASAFGDQAHMQQVASQISNWIDAAKSQDRS